MAKTLAIVLGIIVVIVGVLGFISNPVVGDAGILVTSMALDVLYIILGLILLIVAFAASSQSGMWLKIVGVVYLLVAVLGFLMAPSGGTVLTVFTVNMATNVLHAVLGVVLLAVGFLGKGGKAMAPAAMPAAAPAPAPAPVSDPSNPTGGSM